MSGNVAPLTFNNTEFKVCDPTQPNPVDCIMTQQIGTPNGVVRRTNVQQNLAQQSWAPTSTPQALSAWHTPAFGYFNSTQQELCGSAFRVGVDNTCWAGGPITPAMLSPPYSKNPGAYNMNSGKYLFELTQPIPPLTGTLTVETVGNERTV
jgi:hypothetical protein